MKLLIGILGVSALFAQGAKVDIVSSQQLDRLQKKVSGQKIGLEAIAKYPNSSMQLIRREASGSAELHENKADIFFVREGDATLIEGGTIPNPKTTQPHEVRGETIRGGTKHAIGAGDLVHIPAGVPHQILLAPGKTFTYIAVKIDQ